MLNKQTATLTQILALLKLLSAKRNTRLAEMISARESKLHAVYSTKKNTY